MKERGREERGGGGKGWMVAIARARYKLHLNRSRGTRGIRNLNGHRGGGGGGRREKDLANLVDREEKQESETKRRKEAKSSILKWRWNRTEYHPPVRQRKSWCLDSRGGGEVVLVEIYDDLRYVLLSRGYIDRLSISNSSFRIYCVDDAFRFSLNCTFSRKRFSDIIPFLKNIRQRFDKKHFPKIKLLINRLIEDTVYKYPLLPALEAGKNQEERERRGKKSTFKPMPRIITAFNPGERREG